MQEEVRVVARGSALAFLEMHEEHDATSMFTSHPKIGIITAMALDGSDFYPTI